MSLFGNSRYLTKDDVGTGSILTISTFTFENVAGQNEPAEEKYVMRFHETPKGVVMKPILARQIMAIFGLSDENQLLDGTIFNQQITLYNDPTVAMGNRIVGGIRVRQPQHGDVPYTPPRPAGSPGGAPANFRPDPRQTPPPGSFQQAQHGQHVQPARPAQAPYPQQPQHQPQPAARPAVPRPPMGAPAMPAHYPPAQPSFDGAGTGDDEPPFGEPTGGRF